MASQEVELLLADHGTDLQLGELVDLEVQLEVEVSSVIRRTQLWVLPAS